MRHCGHFLPGFKTTYLTVGILYVLMAGSLFLRGLMNSMREFKVPEIILQSPYYYDSIYWVYTHMMMIGLILCVTGLYASEPKLKKGLSVLLFLVHVYYTYLDFRTSDSVLGNGLYQGPASLFPAVITLCITILFLHLSLCNNSRATKPTENE
jgi:hypothetical protein